MGEEIIGHGTWYDMMAKKVADREKKLGRNLSLIRTEMGLGASGFPHIGSLGDAARSHAVSVALKEMGFNSELVAYCDDKDGLRKVPAGLSKDLEKYLGYPVSSIPDPFDCHKSYGNHMSSLLLEALDRCGLTYNYQSAEEVYAKGLLRDEIRTLLINAKQVGEIVKEEVGQERYTEVLPFFPVCENCGRIYTTKAVSFDPETDKVQYVCEGLEIRGRKIEGCGHKGEASINGGGKLSWKGEFAARWRAFDIRFEAYGKDIADSVRINDRICREVLHFEPPSHARYEMFLDKGGKKISKSAGNVFTPQVWFRYGSPQSLLLLMLKRFVGTRTLDVPDIPSYMNELDALEDVYFGKKQVSGKRELEKERGLYLHCWVMKPPAKPSVHVPYNMLTFLTKMAPKEHAEQFIVEKLQSYGYLPKPSLRQAEPSKIVDGKFVVQLEGLRKRIEYASNWNEDFAEIKETPVSLKPEEKKALKALLTVLAAEDDPDKIQNAIFNSAKANGIQPGTFFRLLYTILMGTPQGPRLGPYVLAMGKGNVVAALERAVGKA
jgi:lysyl-tRNA synthetase class 1